MPSSSPSAVPAVPGPHEREALRRALTDEASTLGARIAQGEDAGIRQQETTITETVLLDLHQRLRSRLDIKMLTQADEGVRGADWIWCVGGTHGWFSFYVQAKKLKPRASYAGYDIGYTGAGQHRQVDKLIMAANAAGVVPVYVLYNPLYPGSSYSGAGCVDALTQGADGFTAVSAYAARELLENGTNRLVELDRMWWVAHPWACLAGCPDGNDRLRWIAPQGQSPTDRWRVPREMEALWSSPLTDAPGNLVRLFAEQAIYAWLVSNPGRSVVRSPVERINEEVLAGYSIREPAWVSDPEDALREWRLRADAYQLGFEPAAVVSQRLGGRSVRDR
ncbi:hypothetical protein [Promicromonospora sp. MEB111]|uniref:hypothetical protein n=1 Tax=Promicromonospora sp. MEB111 TaxID=3040301 RepID=UPI00254FF7EE|nr:hypothetical protein [Promicromonospora sp. MEB111]